MTNLRLLQKLIPYLFNNDVSIRKSKSGGETKYTFKIKGSRIEIRKWSSVDCFPTPRYFFTINGTSIVEHNLAEILYLLIDGIERETNDDYQRSVLSNLIKSL